MNLNHRSNNVSFWMAPRSTLFLMLHILFVSLRIYVEKMTDLVAINVGPRGIIFSLKSSAKQ